MRGTPKAALHFFPAGVLCDVFLVMRPPCKDGLAFIINLSQTQLYRQRKKKRFTMKGPMSETKTAHPTAHSERQPLRVMSIMAHQDDFEFNLGGTFALL